MRSASLRLGAPPPSKRDLGSSPRPRARPGGARRSRTDDILLAKQALYQLSYGPILQAHGRGTVRSPGELSYDTVQGWSPAGLVGPGRLELPTLRLSGVRSNHLSYGPSGSATAQDNQARDRVTRSPIRMIDASVTKVERETETAASRRFCLALPHCCLSASLLEPQ